MPKRMLRVLDNGRHVTRGLYQAAPAGPFLMGLAEGETDTLRVDLNHWLDSAETVASSALSEQEGVTLVKANGSTYVDLTVSGVSEGTTGKAKLAVTTSASRVNVVELEFQALVPVPAYDPWRDSCW